MSDHRRGSRRRTGGLSALAGPLALAGAVATIAASAAVLLAPGADRPGEAEAGEPTADDLPLPGATLVPEIFHVRDAAPVDGRGEWVILDGAERRVHRVAPDGVLLATFGGEGDGPGELRSPASLTVLGDTVLVADLRGTRVDRFSLDGAFLRRAPVEHEECPGARVHGLRVAAGAPVLLLTCIVERTHQEARVYRLLNAGADLLARTDLGDVEGGIINPFHFPILAGGPDGFLLGVLGNPCLRSFDPVGDARSRVCHPWKERYPVTSEERAKLMALQQRIPARTGLRIRVPDHLPPFDRAFITPRGVVFRVLTGPETRRLELLDPEGRLHPLSVPARARSFVGPRTVLNAREVMDGTEILVAPIRD